MIKVYNHGSLDVLMEDKHGNRKLYRRTNSCLKLVIEDELVGEIDGIPVYKENIKSITGLPSQEYDGVM